ncbi:cytochrome c3 family protein, partial [Escherichia coli]
MTTSLDCSSCHRYPVWSAVAFVHSSSAYPGDHASATCIACHSSNTESAAWPSAAYRPSCAGCHATRFKPERHP